MKAALAAAFLLSLSFAAVAQQLSDAVIYREYPEGGPAAANGREIPSSGGVVLHTLDINSRRVQINIDPKKMAAALAAAGIGSLTPEQTALLTRIVALETLMTEIVTAAQQEAQVTSLFHTGAPADFRAAVSASSGRILAIRDTLRAAIQQRLIAEGATPTEADRRAKADIRLLGLGENDWPKVRDLVARELGAAQRAYDALNPNLGVALELQAHLIPTTGDATAIPLPGHNSVKPGPVKPFPKITSVVPSDQEKLFEQFQELAAKTADAKNIGQAFLTALRSDPTVSAIDDQFQKVKADADQIKTLADAVDSNSIDTFLQSLRGAAVANNAADTQLLADVNKLVTDAKGLKSTFKNLSDVSTFADSLKAAPDPVSLLNDILARFQAIGGLGTKLANVDTVLGGLSADLKAVMASLKAASVTPALKDALIADGSPFAPLVGDDGALDTLSVDAKRLVEMVTTFFHAEITATAMAALPVPEGQQRIPVEKVPTTTTFDLQTIPAPRNPGDTVQLSYAFFAGDEPVAVTGWNDSFDLRVYGLRDNILASLALVRHVSESKFKPTAAMSWLLSYDRWPKTAEDRKNEGVSIFSGAGLTTMALDFDPDETVELGIAPTISLINDHLLFGYGWNLQAAKNRTYAFFSIRLLSRPGVLGATTAPPPAPAPVP